MRGDAHGGCGGRVRETGRERSRNRALARPLPPTEKIRAEIDALFGGDRELGEVIEDVARLGARLIIQTALEAEVEVFLGRARYQRSAAAEDGRPGMRNGYGPATVKTTAGPVTIQRPKLRGTTEAFASKLFGSTVTKSNALESLVIAGFVRGLSVRDVESTLADALGAEAALSKLAVSRVCQAIGGQFGFAREMEARAGPERPSAPARSNRACWAAPRLDSLISSRRLRASVGSEPGRVSDSQSSTAFERLTWLGPRPRPHPRAIAGGDPWRGKAGQSCRQVNGRRQGPGHRIGWSSPCLSFPGSRCRI